MRDVFSILKEQRSLKTAIGTVDTVEELKVKWDLVFGTMAKQLKFGYLKDDILTIYAANPAWINEIDYYKKQFIEKVNSLYKKEIIKDIKVRVDSKRKSVFERNLDESIGFKYF